MKRKIEKKPKEPIPEACIHIYVKKSVALGLSRSFKALFETMGVMMLKKTKDQKFDHPNLPVMMSVKYNILKLFIYSDPYKKGNCYVHNFMVVQLPVEIRKILKSTFDNMTRIKAITVELIPPRRSNILLLEFDLKNTVLVGNKLYDARGVFAE